MAFPAERMLDATGWRLLQELQEDARLSFAELGRRVGLSTPAVAERVRNLEAAGLVRGYRAEIDLAKLGLPILAFVRMSVVGDVLGRITAVAQELPEVLECHRGTGDDSFVMKVAVASVEHLGRCARALYADPVVWKGISESGRLVARGLAWENMAAQMYLRLLNFRKSALS